MVGWTHGWVDDRHTRRSAGVSRMIDICGASSRRCSRRRTRQRRGRPGSCRGGARHGGRRRASGRSQCPRRWRSARTWRGCPCDRARAGTPRRQRGAAPLALVGDVALHRHAGRLHEHRDPIIDVRPLQREVGQRRRVARRQVLARPYHVFDGLARDGGVGHRGRRAVDDDELSPHRVLCRFQAWKFGWECDL